MSLTPSSEAEVAAFLAAHPGWKVEAGALVRTYTARSFLDGIAFVQALAGAAEAADHHPDLDVRWKHVTVRFITHDAGNRITALDTRLAAECDRLFPAHA